MDFMNSRDQARIDGVRESSKVCAKIFKILKSEVRPGKSIKEIDSLAADLCKEHNVKPAFLGYGGFPGVICANLNDIVVHGIPKDELLEEGDLFGLDFGVVLDGYYSDLSETLIVGDPSNAEPIARKLREVAIEATMAGIAQAKPGNRVGDISNAMQLVIERAGFTPVYQMVGHGIGRSLHEDPQIPCIGDPGKGPQLKEGQTLAIESMVNEGAADLYIDPDDGWTAYTIDGMLSSLHEHTILVAEKPEVLTIN